MNFADFLELPENKRLKLLKVDELNWWQLIRIKCLNKWWTCMRKTNPDIKPVVLFESMRKGRF